MVRVWHDLTWKLRHHARGYNYARRDGANEFPTDVAADRRLERRSSREKFRLGVCLARPRCTSDSRSCSSARESSRCRKSDDVSPANLPRDQTPYPRAHRSRVGSRIDVAPRDNNYLALASVYPITGFNWRRYYYY